MRWPPPCRSASGYSSVRDPVTNGARIGRERGDARRHRRRGVDRDAQRRRRRPGIAGRIARRRRQAVRAVRQRRRRIAPGPAAVGHRAAQQRRTVKDLDRGVGLRRAGQRQRVVIGDAVAHRAAVGRERGNGRRHRRRRVNRHAQRRRRRPGIAGRIGRRRRQAVRAVRQRRCRIAPGAAAVRHRAAQQRRTVKDLDRCVGLRRAGQRQRVVIGDAVAHRAAVGRERGDARRHRRRRVNRHAQRRRGRTRYWRPHRSPSPSGCARRSPAPPSYSSRRRCRWPPRCPTASHRQRP